MALLGGGSVPQSPCALLSAAARQFSIWRKIAALALTALILGCCAEGTQAQQRVIEQHPTDSRTSTVRSTVQRWSDTVAMPVGTPQKPTRFIGRLPGYEEAKRQSNARAPSVQRSPAGTFNYQAPELGLAAPGSVVFDGPNESNTPFIPPDSMIAAGPNHLVVAINALLAIYDKSGVQQGSFQDLKAFFSGLALTGDIFDPRLIYDQQDGRFILSAGLIDFQNFTNGYVLVAVSQTSDPTGAWNKFAINFMGRNLTNTANTFPDFPGLGLGPTAIYITSNQFVLDAQCLGPNPNAPCAFSDAWIKVIALPQLLAGNPNLNISTFTNVRTGSGQLAFSIQPALSYGATNSEFLVAASFEASPGNVLNLFSINTTGTPALQELDLTVPSFSLAPQAVQPGTSGVIDTGDFRTLNAIWNNGSLWCGQNVASAANFQSAARWYEIQISSISSASLVQSGDVSASGAAYYPAISQRADGMVAMAFTTSSATLSPSSAFTARNLGDPPGTMQGYVIYRLGLGPYDEPRWGDYSGISQDWDGNSFWAITEYAGQPDPHFATAITQISQPPSLSVTPTELSFGTVPVSKPSSALSATFTNSGSSAITLGTARISGPNAADYSVSSDQCSGVTLSPTKTCSVSVILTPSQQTRETAILSLNYALGQMVVGLDGTGLNVPIIDVTPNSLSFPPTPQQTASAPLTLTVNNSGTLAGSFFIALVPQAFTSTTNCPSMIPPQTTCQVFVTFRPTAATTYNWFVELLIEGAGAAIHVTGTGVTSPFVTLCPASLAFGNQPTGTTSVSQSLILTNSGSAPLVITGIAASGDFAETDNCGGGFGPRQSCSIQVTFTPSALGTRISQIVINDNAPGSPHKLMLTGSGSSTTIGMQQREGTQFLSSELKRKSVDADRQQRVIAADRPLSFERNLGQWDAEVRFASRLPGLQMGIIPNGIVLRSAAQEPPKNTSGFRDARPLPMSQVNMVLAGANPHARITGLHELPGKTNYFVGTDATRWRTNVPTYARIRLQNIYPGVDLIYYGKQGRFEYDFIVSPGADPRKIRLRFEGNSALRVVPNGDLVVSIPTGELHLQKPVVYQSTDASGSNQQARVYRSGDWVVERNSVAAFRLGPYDPQQALIIDPVLSFSTYLGGSGGESGTSIGLDASNNVYVAGFTYSFDFPVTANAIIKTCGTGRGPCNAADSITDGFVAKFSPDGSTLLYATYLGGGSITNAYTQINGLAVDSAGNAYAVGNTLAPDFPTTPGSLQPKCIPFSFNSECSSGFVVKLDPTGSSLLYSTYLGGTPSTSGFSSAFPSTNAVAVDSQGEAYVGGATASADFPISLGAFETSPPAQGHTHAFLSKLNSAGSGLNFSTFLGGSGGDVINAIALDPSGNVTVAGSSSSLDFPTSPGALQTGSFGPDSFVAKFSSAGKNLYSTLLGGGTSSNVAKGVAVDDSGAWRTRRPSRRVNFLFPHTEKRALPTRARGDSARWAKYSGEPMQLRFLVFRPNCLRSQGGTPAH